MNQIEKEKTILVFNKEISKTKIKKNILKIYSLINLIVCISLLLTVIIVNNNKLHNFFNIKNFKTDNCSYYSLKIYLIFILIFITIANLLLVLIVNKEKWFLLIKENYFISSLIIVFSLNIIMLVYIFLLFNKERTEREFINKKFWITFKYNLRIKKWLTKDYVLIALFCALTITFSYIEENLLPHMPFGGGVGLKYIPLMLISLTTGFFGGWLTGFTSSLIALLFIPASNIINPWSFILDYFLPMTTPSIIAFLPFKVENNKNIFTYINYFLHCFLVLIIVWFWQILSGYLVWTKLYPTDVWKGYSPMLYSIIYNFIHIFIFTYPLLQVIIPILYRSLGVHFLNKR